MKFFRYLFINRAQKEDARDSHPYLSTIYFATSFIFYKNIVHFAISLSLIVSKTSFDARLQLAWFSQDFHGVYKEPMHELKRDMFLHFGIIDANRDLC